MIIANESEHEINDADLETLINSTEFFNYCTEVTSQLIAFKKEFVELSENDQNTIRLQIQNLAAMNDTSSRNYAIESINSLMAFDFNDLTTIDNKYAYFKSEISKFSQNKVKDIAFEKYISIIESLKSVEEVGITTRKPGYWWITEVSSKDIRCAGWLLGGIITSAPTGGLGYIVAVGAFADCVLS